MTIYICGDSTAASYGPEQAPLAGWGQFLGGLLPGTAVDNRAMAGRSTRTFLQEGRLSAIEDALAAGDLVLIQFGHNDEGDKPERHTEPWADFTDNLDTFIRVARSHGARPVLMTPICIRLFQGGQLQPSHGEYLKAVCALAERRGVPLIDLYAVSRAVVLALGDESSRELYMHIAPGVYPAFPDGATDDTHTRPRGAEIYADAVAQALRDMNLVS